MTKDLYGALGTERTECDNEERVFGKGERGWREMMDKLVKKK